MNPFMPARLITYLTRSSGHFGMIVTGKTAGGLHYA